ncbi:MAG: response regulator [bacterium]
MNKKAIKILVVDDDESILSSISRALKTEGYTVITENKPEKALDYVRNNIVHIALVDILMPKIDGITVLNVIRDVNGLSQVIMMSAYTTVDRIITALESSANDFIIKPFDSVDVVLKTVERAAAKLDRWKKVLKDTGAI